MIKQIQKFIDLFLLIDKNVKGRPISLACMDQIHEKFERLQYDIYQLASVIEKGFTKDSWYAVRWDVSNITSELSTLNELINQVLGKKRFQPYEHSKEVQDLAKQGAKQDIIRLLEESLVLIKKEFKREGDLSKRVCELQRGEKEIEKLHDVLQKFDEYLNFVHKNLPKTRQEIRRFIHIVGLFLTQIEFYINFIVWITKFWITAYRSNVRFLQLHDE